MDLIEVDGELITADELRARYKAVRAAHVEMYVYLEHRIDVLSDEIADMQCDAGNWDGGSTLTCDHCQAVAERENLKRLLSSVPPHGRTEGENTMQQLFRFQITTDGDGNILTVLQPEYAEPRLDMPHAWNIRISDDRRSFAFDATDTGPATRTSRD